MKLKAVIHTLLLFILFGIFGISCTSENQIKKVVYINSYHRGHPSSDEIMDAIIGYFPEDSFNVASYFMDTKRHPNIEHIEEVAAQLYDSILKLNPEILIVSDDNAVKYIVQPNIDKLSMPVVFCGVNGSDKEYNLPADKVTGMIEVLPVAETIMTLRPYYPTMSHLLVLTENTTTSNKEKVLLDTLFTRAGVSATYALVDDFEKWKSTFKEANQKFDIVYIVTHGAIKGWDHEEAVRFVDEYIEVPVFTCEDFMMPYAVFGMTKVAKEQGIWAAEIAKKIMNGSTPNDFAVTRNKLSTTWLNTSLAEKISFYPDTSLLDNFRIVNP